VDAVDGRVRQVLGGAAGGTEVVGAVEAQTAEGGGRGRRGVQGDGHRVVGGAGAAEADAARGAVHGGNDALARAERLVDRVGDVRQVGRLVARQGHGAGRVAGGADGDVERGGVARVSGRVGIRAGGGRRRVVVADRAGRSAGDRGDADGLTGVRTDLE